MLDKIKKMITKEFIYKIYSKYLGEGVNKGNDEYAFICPFHKDTKPSFMVNIDPEKFGIYNCFVCNDIDTPQKKGNILSFITHVVKVENAIDFLGQQLGIEEKKKVSQLEIQDAKEELSTNKAALQLLHSFGITDSIIQEYDIGFKKTDLRYWIPIKDMIGDFVNVRRYDPCNKDNDKKMLSYKTGYGSARLWPIQAIRAQDIYLFEGEKDCLVALSLGINAITTTGGASTWKDEWNTFFKNKNVTICYDIDEPGVTGALRIARKLHPLATQVKIVHLPLSLEEFPRGDFTNWVGLLHSKEDFLNLVRETTVFVPNAKTQENNTEIYKCTLAEASKPFYANKKCDIGNVLVVGRNKTPYQIPKKVLLKCTTANKKKFCFACPANDQDYILEFDKKDYWLMEMIDTSKGHIESIIQKAAGIPDCKGLHIEIVDKYAVDKIELTSNVTYNIEENYEYVKRTGYYITDSQTEEAKKIDTNRSYNLKAITVSNPADQSTEHQVYDIDVADTNIDAFVLTEDIYKQLQLFQVSTTIEDKLKEIYTELGMQARIYEREDLFLLYDLAFHSALSFNFQDKNIGKGWVEVCVIGDSGVGKSETGRFLIKYYGAGDFVDGETATLAGLKGALSQSNGTWNLSWGRLPINDRKLVMIDEGTGLSIEDIGALSNIRSSGECVIQKVIADKTRSRTRLIWIANCRKQNTGIKDYAHGVETIKDFFGKPEDVRRVDVAITCASGEVSIVEINKTHTLTTVKYTKDACHNLILFAWSRKSEDIYISKEVENYILEKAVYFGQIYSASIPLVEPSDVRNKIARLSVAIAIRVFSIDNLTRKVVVTKEHVAFICSWIMKVYAKPRFQYDSFSKKELKKTTLLTPDLVDTLLLLDDYANVTELLDYAIISKQELADIMGLTVSGIDFQKNLHMLKRANAITILDRRVKLNACLLDHLRTKKQKETKESF